MRGCRPGDQTYVVLNQAFTHIQASSSSLRPVLDVSLCLSDFSTVLSIVRNTYLFGTTWLFFGSSWCRRCRCSSRLEKCLQESESCWLCRAAVRSAGRWVCPPRSRRTAGRCSSWAQALGRSPLSCSWSCSRSAVFGLRGPELQKDRFHFIRRVMKKTWRWCHWRCISHDAYSCCFSPALLNDSRFKINFIIPHAAVSPCWTTVAFAPVPNGAQPPLSVDLFASRSIG